MMNDVVSYVQEDVGFYPTPPELVEKMLEGVEWRSIKTVLEPSAGKGNIVYGVLNAIYKYRHRNWRSFYDSRDFMGIKIDCIEIDPNLRGVLDYTFFGKKARNICAFLTLAKLVKPMKSERKRKKSAGYVPYTIATPFALSETIF